MKKKILLVLAIMSVLVCIFAISVSATPQGYSTFEVTLTDGTQKTAYTAGVDQYEGRVYLNPKLYAEAPVDTDGTYEEIEWTTVKEIDFSSSMLYIYSQNKKTHEEWAYGSNNGGSMCIIPNGIDKKTQLTALEKVTTGKALILREGAFNGAPALKTLVISKSLKSMQNNVFYYCTALETIIFEDGSAFESLNDSFLGCTSLKSVSFPASITRVGENAFNGCTSLVSVSFAEGTSCTIKNNAFNGCTSLTSVTLVEGITAIGNAAFQNCDSLVSISIPDSVETVGSYIFASCDKLEQIAISENSLISNRIIGFADGCPMLKEIRIPPLVTDIGYDNFRNCYSLENIIWSDNLLKISGGNNFPNTAVTSVTLPNSLTFVNGSTFSGCKIEEFRLSANLTSLEAGLLNIKTLKRVYIPASIASVGKNLLGYSNPADSSSNITFIFTGNIEQANALRAMVLAVTEGTNHQPNSSKLYDAILVSASEYDATQEPSGFHFVYDYNLCDAFYGGDHSEGQVINQCQFGCGRNCGKAELLENPQHELSKVTTFGENGYFDASCVVESCGICKTVTLNESVDAIFVNYGYSMTEVEIGGKLSMSQFFGIDKANLEEYTTLTGNAFEYGFVVSSNADPMNEANSGLIAEGKTYITTQNGFKHDYFAVAVAGFTDATVDNALTFCVYVKDGEKVSYLDNGETVETVNMKSYNQIKALLGK